MNNFNGYSGIDVELVRLAITQASKASYWHGYAAGFFVGGLAIGGVVAYSISKTKSNKRNRQTEEQF